MEYKGYKISDIDTVLLFEILQELKEIKEALRKPEAINVPEIIVEKKLPVSKKENKTCKHCGKPHEKPVDYAKCAKAKGKVN